MKNRTTHFEKKGTANTYDAILDLPLISSIRQEEAAALYYFFKKNIHGENSILEIGSGTGFYSVPLSHLANEVTALEPSEAMIKILIQRVSEEKILNLRIINSTLESYKPEKNSTMWLWREFWNIQKIGKRTYESAWIFQKRPLSLLFPKKVFWEIYINTFQFRRV